MDAECRIPRCRNRAVSGTQGKVTPKPTEEVNVNEKIQQEDFEGPPKAYCSVILCSCVHREKVVHIARLRSKLKL